MKTCHLHLVSDSTGETIKAVARACLVQFEDVEVEEHHWSMMRTPRELSKTLTAIETEPGVVLFTLVDPELRALLMDRCRQLQVPCIPVLDPVLSTLSGFFGRESRGQPGRQHVLDQEYFERIDAMQFALNHDDGQAVWNLEEADVVLVGVSRTSKTPTCIYLANRGYRAANVPIVPNCPVPPQLAQLRRPLIIGLTKDPMSLVQVRRHRVKLLHQDEDTDYTDPDVVREEVAWARKLFNQNGWPVLDVSRRSIEETAASIIRIHAERQEAEDAADD